MNTLIWILIIASCVPALFFTVAKLTNGNFFNKVFFRGTGLLTLIMDVILALKLLNLL